jgi:hypothetical protein
MDLGLTPCVHDQQRPQASLLASGERPADEDQTVGRRPFMGGASGGRGGRNGRITAFIASRSQQLVPPQAWITTGAPGFATLPDSRSTTMSTASRQGLSPRLRPYVPSSQLARYLACSSVSWSISMPIVASFSRAISRSISSGTG